MAVIYLEQVELNYVVECEHIENNGELCIENAKRAIGNPRRMVFLCERHARRKEYKRTHVNVLLTYESGAIKVEEFNRAAAKENHTRSVQRSLSICKV